MKRLCNRALFSVLASIAALSLTACGGGSHVSTLPQPASIASTSPYTGPLADATFTLKIPAPKSSTAAKRKPAYISPATKSVRVNLTSPSGGPNVLTQVSNAGGSTPGAPCTGSGPYTCTITMRVPPGNDTFTFSTYDDTTGTGTGASHILSQQIKTLTIVAGRANSPTTDANFAIVFDANAATITVTGSQLCHSSGSVGSAYGSVGTTPVTFPVTYTDPAGQAITSPGLPILSVNGFKDGAPGHTINGTTGYATVTVNQSSQTFTLTPSASTVAGVNVNVAATPANSAGGSDGLSFSQTTSFAFSTGPAPTRPFLAVVEQLGANSGQIALFNLTGFTDTSTNDSINAATPSTLASQNNDVDNPQGLAFDASGDLLIANGGTTVGSPPDYGNFACVPAGAIATGANAATVLGDNPRLVNDGVSIAYGTDNSVAIANNPASADDNLVEFTLNGSYQPAGASRYIANPAHTVGAFSVITMPTLSAGTYAIGITDGTSTYKVALKEANGTETDITDPTIVNPKSLAWDPASAQLVIPSGRYTKDNSTCPGQTPCFCPPANTATCYADIDFYSVGTSSPPSPVKVNVIPSTYNNRYAIANRVAASSAGYLAVAISPSSGKSGQPVIQIYNASRTKVSAIPYNTLTASCSNFSGCPYIGGDPCGGCSYEFSANGNGIVVNDLRFLSAHKLLVALQSDGNSTEGLYIYDVTKTEQPPGYDDGTGAAPGLAPLKTGFLQTTLRPFGTAFLP